MLLVIAINLLQIFFYFISLSLSITTTIIGSLRIGNCDRLDMMGLYVSDYLLGLGISGIISAVIQIILCILMLRAILRSKEALYKCFMILCTAFNIILLIFNISWFIVGGIILFRSNIECIRSSSVSVIYALVVWCIEALSILFTIFKIMNNLFSSNNN